MGKIVISENVSLDGVVQDPTGEEGFRHGGWFNECGGKDLAGGERSSFRRRSAPRPCCSVGAAMSISQHGGHPGLASGRTG